MQFQNSLVWADKRDVEGLADHVKKEFPEFTDVIEDARKIANVDARDQALRQVVTGNIRTLLETKPRPSTQSADRSKPADPDQKAQKALGGFSDSLIQKAMMSLGKTREETIVFLQKKLRNGYAKS